MTPGRPHIAIVDPNVLATIGLRQLLETVVPMMAVDVYPTFDAFLAGGGEGCYHYFVAQSVAVAHHLWFMDRRRKTLVLTLSSDPHSQLAGFRHLCVGVAEEALVCEVLRGAPILLLDEATSALDEKTEAQVLKNLLTALPDTACILTTHRPGALKYCTRLYKAENGALTCIEVNKPA